jgi:hypothetical protein
MRSFTFTLATDRKLTLPVAECLVLFILFLSEPLVPTSAAAAIAVSPRRLLFLAFQRGHASLAAQAVGAGA